MLFRRKPTADDARAALSGVVPAPMIESIYFPDDRSVIVSLLAGDADPATLEPARQKAEDALQRLPGIRKATAILTAERPASKPAGPARKPATLDLPHVRHIIAVASGKGGVGKSTVAANLAVALSALYPRVGLMDADIYGPSVPRLMGIADSKPAQDAEGRITPIKVHGIHVMSMGFMVAEEKPMIWRGPMVQSALMQLLRDVAWGSAVAPMDVLVLDMPPGTGDAQLTIAQKVPLSGAVIVSTPQDIALIDARKGLSMFQAVAVPILGIVENMSYFCCPSCGHRSDIFGHGGARADAIRLGVPFLGEIPLRGEIRAASDDGKPVALSDQGAPYQAIAALVATALKADPRRPAPAIRIID